MGEHRTATVADVMKRMQEEPRYERYSVADMGWGMGNAQNGIETAVREAEKLGLVTVEKNYADWKLMASLTDAGKTWVETPQSANEHTGCDGSPEHTECRRARPLDARTAALVAGVREHAQKNYDKDGWDYVVETYEDADLANEFGDAQTIEEAVTRIALNVGALDENRQEMTPLASWHY